jgi:hypothetical protein
VRLRGTILLVPLASVTVLGIFSSSFDLECRSYTFLRCFEYSTCTRITTDAVLSY